jgi:UDPglucose 6-dehydrogenase
LTGGSPAILLKNQIEARGFKVETYDPYIDRADMFDIKDIKRIYFIGTKHAVFATWRFPQGSIVLDPFRYIPKQKGVNVVHIGNPGQPQKRKVLAE